MGELCFDIIERETQPRGENKTFHPLPQFSVIGFTSRALFNSDTKLPSRRQRPFDPISTRVESRMRRTAINRTKAFYNAFLANARDPIYGRPVHYYKAVIV